MKYKENEKWSGLYDILGKKILYGNVVHWSDGGDELPLEKNVRYLCNDILKRIDDKKNYKKPKKGNRKIIIMNCIVL